MDDFSAELQKNLTSGIVELINNLQTIKPELAQDLIHLIENETKLNQLESLVFQLTRVFGSIAFQQEDDLTPFYQKIKEITQEDLIFQQIVLLYLEHISLNEINSQLKNEELETQSQYLHSFILSCINK